VFEERPTQGGADDLGCHPLQPTQGCLLNELYWLAETIKRTAEGIFAKARPGSNDQTYLQVDHNLHRQMITVLSDAVKIKALLVERRKRKGQSTAEHEILVRRAHRLRHEVLTGIEISELFDAKVRNSLEHFDEYLDATVIRCYQRKAGLPTLLPVDLSMGNRFDLPCSVRPDSPPAPARPWI
jgi:hypothetical protein